MLLAGGQALVLLALGEVPDHLGDLVDVAGTELGQVDLVSPAPVGGDSLLLLAKQVEHLPDLALGDHLPEPDLPSVVHGNHESQVTVGQAQLEVGATLTQNLPLHKVLDNCGPMVRVDDLVSLLERNRASGADRHRRDTQDNTAPTPPQLKSAGHRLVVCSLWPMRSWPPS